MNDLTFCFLVDYIEKDNYLLFGVFKINDDVKYYCVFDTELNEPALLYVIGNNKYYLIENSKTVKLYREFIIDTFKESFDDLKDDRLKEYTRKHL